MSDDLLNSTILRRTMFRGALASALMLAGMRPAAAQERITLQVLSTTDLHMYLEDYDYYADKPDSDVGLVRVASLIRAARAASPNTILVDNGDLIQGTPMGDWIARERGIGADKPHPAMTVFNLLGYDAAVLGNHEFNFGLDILKATYAGAKFPVLAGNVFTVQGDDPDRYPTLYPAYTILERRLTDNAGNAHTVKVGLLGLLTPQIVIWDRDKLEGKVVTRDIVDMAKRLVPEMKAKGADVVVVLCHAGISPVPREGGDENAGAYLTEVEGIDAVVTGHSHRVFPGPDYAGFPKADLDKGTVNGRPVVMAGAFGSHLGVTELVLEKAGEGWRVVDGRAEARPITQRIDNRPTPVAQPDAEVAALIAADHQGTLRYVRRPVGRSTGRIHSYFAMLGDSAAVEIVAEAQRTYAERVLKGTAHAALPILSAVSPFKVGGRPGPDFYTDIPAGQIAIRNVADLYVYPNFVTLVRVTGAEVREWLEMSTRVFNRLDPAATGPQFLVDGRVPGYSFDIMDGVTYRIDLSQPQRYDRDGNLINPQARRIVDLAYQGKPIDDAQEFVVATNNYRANGGGRVPGLDGSKNIFESPDTVQQAIVDYIRNQGVIEPRTDHTWHFAPVPGVENVVYDIGPVAQQLLEEAPYLSYTGPAENGFSRFKVDLGALAK